MIWIGYTTRYREGGPQLAQAAHTLAELRRRERPETAVRCVAVESKRDFVDEMRALGDAGDELDELHFVGHSGMYGPMFRTTAMPEQFSPHEWRTLTLPFAPDGQAWFHACRTARWFAPFFARTFGVPTWGYHWYTSFSTRADRYRWPGPTYPADKPLFLVGCKGRKSHGLAASIIKYAGVLETEQMKRFNPAPIEGEASYDDVAPLYDAVFRDIRVRRDEWRWLEARFDEISGSPRVLDIGCGNGALLDALAPRISAGHGVDRSAGMIALAQGHNRHAHLGFQTVDGPVLPLPDASVDVVTSLLSFRYLDWDPLMAEVRRVLAPGGRLLIVDMVTAPARSRELPRLVWDSLRAAGTRVTQPAYRRALRALVSDERWATMLRYNPIRAQHEYVWYLESRFPGRRVETLNIGGHARVLAFDSGPLDPGQTAPQSYP